MIAGVPVVRETSETEGRLPDWRGKKHSTLSTPRIHEDHKEERERDWDTTNQAKICLNPQPSLE